MKVLLVLVLSLLSIKCISGIASKRASAFKSVNKCAKEHGLDYKTISSFVKGDFSIDSQDAKCFLKCVANDLEFWIDEKPQKHNMIPYVHLLVKKVEGAGDIIDKCIATDVSNDFCQHLYNVYKCFWTETKVQPNQKIDENEDFSMSDNELKKE